jgi:multiple sugar transport system substrate-binding protein
VATAALGVALGASPKRIAKAASAKPKVTIVVRGFFGPKTNDLFKLQAEDWGKKNNVDVVCDIISMNDIPAKIATAAEAGAGPDIIHLFDGVPYLYADKLVDVTDVANAVIKENGEFYDIAKQVCSQDGKWFALPHTGTTHVMVYRIDVFKKLGIGVPNTWDEFLEAGKKLKANKYTVGWPIAHAAGDGNTFMYTILWCYGGKEVEKDGKTLALDSPGTVKCLEMIKKLYDQAFDPGVTSWDDSSNNRAFLAGQLALTGNSPSIYNASFKDAPHLTEHIGHAMYPVGPGGRHLRAETQSFGLFKYSKVQDEAKALMKYLISKPHHGQWLEAAGGDRVGMLKTYNSLEMWSKDPKLRPVMEAMEFAHMQGWPGPTTRASAEAFNNFVLIDMATMVVKGSTPKEAIAWAVDQYKKLLRS